MKILADLKQARLQPGLPLRRRVGRASSGFTLIEIIVAMAILGALAAIGIPQFSTYRENARRAQAYADIRNIDLAVRKYKAENGDWPTDLTALNMTDIPTDPWGGAYVYLKIEGVPSATGSARKDQFLVPLNSDFDVYSKGSNGTSVPPISTPQSQDDVLRANDGRYVGLASSY